MLYSHTVFHFKSNTLVWPKKGFTKNVSNSETSASKHFYRGWSHPDDNLLSIKNEMSDGISCAVLFCKLTKTWPRSHQYVASMWPGWLELQPVNIKLQKHQRKSMLRFGRSVPRSRYAAWLFRNGRGLEAMETEYRLSEKRTALDGTSNQQ